MKLLRGRPHKRSGKWLLLYLVIAAALAYTWHNGLPPYVGSTFIYPGRRDARIAGRIQADMADICRDYPDPGLRAKVRGLRSAWSKLAKRPGLALSMLEPGVGALPYVEEMTRSRDSEERLMGYDLLRDFHISGTAASYGEATDRAKELAFRRKHVDAIWERALYDPLPEVRRLALRFSWLPAGEVRVYRRMLRDPDIEVRLAAARVLMWRYHRPDLVPPGMRKRVTYGEVE